MHAIHNEIRQLQVIGLGHTNRWILHDPSMCVLGKGPLATIFGALVQDQHPRPPNLHGAARSTTPPQSMNELAGREANQ